MDLYARVNILDGRSVRLPHGNVATAVSLDSDPLGRTQAWVAAGADRIHLVDLDAAAYGDYRNRDLIDRIVQTVDAPIQVAGGIRSHVEAKRLIDAGAWKIVMGTAAIEDQNMIWDLCRDHPGRIAVSLDVRPDGELATRGWTKNSGRSLEDVLIEMSSAGVTVFLVAEAGRNALEEPPDLRILGEALAMVQDEDSVIASGGVRHLDDLRDLLALNAEGRRLGGVVVGREVTSGRFTIEEAKEVIASNTMREPDEAEPAGPTVQPPVVTRAEADFIRLAEELERAAAHARTAVDHLKSGDVNAGLAQGFSVSGHMTAAADVLEELSRRHSEYSGRRA